MSSIKQRKRTLDGLRHPDFVPTHKFVDNSKILQLAFLDKIIEECDDDLTKNKVTGNLKNFSSFIYDQ